MTKTSIDLNNLKDLKKQAIDEDRTVKDIVNEAVELAKYKLLLKNTDPPYETEIAAFPTEEGREAVIEHLKGTNWQCAKIIKIGDECEDAEETHD